MEGKDSAEKGGGKFTYFRVTVREEKGRGCIREKHNGTANKRDEWRATTTTTAPTMRKKIFDPLQPTLSPRRTLSPIRGIDG